MKTVVIVHGWDATSQSNWIPWLKKELEKRNFKVIAPDMPITRFPIIPLWINKIRSIIKNPDKDTYFIGHSIGCQAILRYIQKLPEKTKLGGALFVAGWFNLDNLDKEDWRVKYVAMPWTKSKINFSKIKSKLKKINVLISTDEPYGYVKENTNTFRTKLKANVTIKNKLEHFCEPKMPIILNKFLQLTK